MTAIQTWWQVVITFLKLSLFSIGGGNTLLQAYHREAVETFGWLTNRQFSDLYGLAEAAPGPSSMFVGLLGLGAGWKHGPVWALITGYSAEIAILLPSTVVMLIASVYWNHWRDSPWRMAFERGLGPVTLGILFSVSVTILKTANHSLIAYGLSFMVCFFVLKTKISPLVFIGICGLAGVLGFVR
ncbi:chromate transporter [Synechococcus sp. UW179A]|uniref:chromate transporter n=1 Tax=Synechococcus sp. UW179A TaxID=2575510 RepID=UPI000E0EAFC1|nr:chromate transporter [Synechococcus sp. UW179A]